MTHKGTKTIETERLILRRFTEDDAEDMYRNWASDPLVTRYMSWALHENVDITHRIISGWVKQYPSEEFYQWVITMKYGEDAYAAIGSIALVPVNIKDSSGVIGYALSRKYWGHGLMTEALGGVLGYLFDEVGFERLTAVHHIQNTASGRVMEKNGMKYTGFLDHIHRNGAGELVDAKEYTIFRSDWSVKK